MGLQEELALARGGAEVDVRTAAFKNILFVLLPVSFVQRSLWRF